MLMPPVSRFMTCRPVTIDRLATLANARQLMRQHGIRHLPVLDAGLLCGILSDRDLEMVERMLGAEAETTLVHAAMTDRPFVVTADTALDEVADVMGTKKYGSVVVVGRDGVEGIFTAVDACAALAQVLQRAVA
jgi:acetoin utilization protein AcuB